MPETQVSPPSETERMAAAEVAAVMSASPGPWIPGRVTILSIWPRRMVKRMTLMTAAEDGTPTSGMVDFAIEAAPPDGYSLLTVFDSFQSTLQGRRPVLAEQIARACVGDWAADTTLAKSGFRPGLSIIVGARPTVEELARERETQTGYCQAAIAEADALLAAGELRPLQAQIALFRLCAEWLGVRDREWYRELRRADYKKNGCPACGAVEIPHRAQVCPQCSKDLVEFYSSRGRVPDEDEDPVVRAEMLRMRKAGRPVAAG